MVAALIQARESSSDYDAATVALFVVFLLSLVVTSGLIIRDVLRVQQRRQDSPTLPQPPSEIPRVPAPFVDRQRVPIEPHPEPRPAVAAPVAEHSAPAWISQAISSHRASVVLELTRTLEQLIDAGNAGDLRSGFACYTDTFLQRYQREHGLSAGDIERMISLTTVAAEHPISIAAIRDVVVDPPARAMATVDYRTGEGVARPPERYALVLDPQTNRWLIDFIEPAAHAGPES
jgi:hypothetical protein